MPTPASTQGPNVPSPADHKRGRTTALISVVIAVILSIAAWFGLSDAADVGVARIARIDQARILCDSGWKAATTMRDSETVDQRSLTDTIDRGTNAVLTRCGHLRPNGLPAGRANPRDITPTRGDR